MRVIVLFNLLVKNEKKNPLLNLLIFSSIQLIYG